MTSWVYQEMKTQENIKTRSSSEDNFPGSALAWKLQYLLLEKCSKTPSCLNSQPLMKMSASQETRPMLVMLKKAVLGAMARTSLLVADLQIMLKLYLTELSIVLRFLRKRSLRLTKLSDKSLLQSCPWKSMEMSQDATPP